MKTVREILNLSTEYLQKYQIKSPRRNSEEILSYVLGVNRIDLYMDIDRPLEELELEKCRALLKRRSQGEPLDYLKGHKEFFGLDLIVTPDVLIPRQETEIMVSKIEEKLKSVDLQGKSLWDVCTGSGCIALALKKRFPDLKILASDYSEDALNIAKKNAQNLGLEISFFKGDLLEPFKGMKVDFITCNPPYISEGDYLGLEKEVLNFEPRMALVGGEKGMEIYEKLEKELPSYLNPGAQVFFEIGYDQGEALQEIFRSSFWKVKEVIKDYASHDRFFFLEIE